MLIAIDPGASGAIAFSDDGIKASVETMPDTLLDIWELLRDLCDEGNVRCYIENVGKYRPGNSGPAAATFARHVGALEMALTGLGIQWERVAPTVWQKRIGALPSNKADRKREIKARMQAMFPYAKCTLGTADALGILAWALDQKR